MFFSWQRKIISAAIFGLIFFCIPIGANAVENAYPKLANFYLHTPISNATAAGLARFDVLILHMLAGQNSAEQIREIRRLNPNIIILVYIASEEFPVDMHASWDTTPNGLFKKQLRGITDEMWLKNDAGNHVVFWGSNWMLNVTDYPTNNKRWTDYLSDFVAKELLSTGLYDGVFYDNSWYDVSWIQNGAIDADKNGSNDNKTSLDAAWRAGMTKLFHLTREKAGKPIYIVGNGDRGYYGDINGIYFENFTTAPYISWEEKMRLYKLSADTSAPQRIAIVGNTGSDKYGSQANYQKMRFGLASALMENGYYSYDAGSSSHAENWWYDEYNINLGTPMGSSQSLGGAGSGYFKDVWRREFSNGIALVNSLAESREIDLGGEFEKIIGSQDPEINNGAIVSKVKLPAKDGLLMLKTYQSVNDLVFVNGAMTRFTTMAGARARNGFFAYDSRYPGGARILFTDLDGNDGRETIIASGPKLEIFNSAGDRWFSDYPFGGNFKGDIRLSVGKIFEKQTEDQILISPSFGGKIIMYNYHGGTMQAGYSPFAKYVGGFSVAAAQFDGADKAGSIVVGVGKGKPAEVLIYDNRLSNITKRFYPYDKTYKGGIYVSAGDLNGDKKDEIIVSPAASKTLPVRVFNSAGKKLAEFKTGALFGASGSMVGTVDINYDGKMEVAVTSL